MYKKVETKLDFVAGELEVMRFWKENKIFEQRHRHWLQLLNQHLYYLLLYTLLRNLLYILNQHDEFELHF